MTGVFIKRGNLDTDTQREGHVKMKAEMEVMFLQAKEHNSTNKPPETRKEAWNGLLLTAPDRTTLLTAGSQTFHLQNYETIHFCSSHSVCGTLLRQL